MKLLSLKQTSLVCCSALSITLSVASFAGELKTLSVIESGSHNNKHVAIAADTLDHAALSQSHKNTKHKAGHQHGNQATNDHEAENNKQQSDHQDDGLDQHQQGVSFTTEQMALANIKVTPLRAQIFTSSIYAPGEIKANGYTSYIVSPRTESVVVNRHATLGEHVEKGQALVTLFSESVAQAQADYRVAYSEWQRVKKLIRGTVSDSRLLKNETDYNAAFGRLKAFGLTQQAIDKIVKNNSSNLGEYTLVAQRAGAVLNDDFAQGQRMAAGDMIMLLADEQNLWVEARISPNKKLNLPIGTLAKVELGGQVHDARVIQEAHTIDPITRTRIIRLSLSNEDDSLHSGMFVNVNFQFDTPEPVIAVPESALMRGADGDWGVFVEDHPGEFQMVEVQLAQALGEYRQILGLAPNSRVVTEGAFFVASEIAKGGFDPHGH
jgi:cobalt-zinc-cadmium efflux system membrane fusion protein